MKKIIIVAFVLVLPVSVLAQDRNSQTEQMQIQYLAETGQLRIALGQALAQIKQLNDESKQLREENKKFRDALEEKAHNSTKQE